jgi:predicted RNA-binding Zn ribbon-like protein
MDFLPGGPKIIKRNEYQFVYEPIYYDYAWFRFNIMSSFGELLTVVDKERLRICENPDCRFLFYDNSRNSTKRHCQHNCSNLMKARRFREKSANK